MNRRILFQIGDDESFDESKYPKISREMDELSREVYLLAGDHKAEVIISFLKNHCISSAYLPGNGRIVRKLISGAVETTWTEALFESCQGNSIFLRAFELYIKEHFN